MLDLKKGDVAILDLDKFESKKIHCGLGWDTRADLDVHAVLRDDKFNILGICYYGNKKIMGVSLSGDNLTGEGSGDDETIYIDLENIDIKVAYVSLYVNVFSSGMTFKDVKGSYVRLYDPINEKTLAKASLEEVKSRGTKTVHFADIEILNNLEFTVVMEESQKNPRGMADDCARGETEKHVQQEKVIKKKKKFFGLF